MHTTPRVLGMSIVQGESSPVAASTTLLKFPPPTLSSKGIFADNIVTTLVTYSVLEICTASSLLPAPF